MTKTEKVKFANKFEKINKHNTGTIAKGESKTNKSQQADAEIYQCLKKYGMTALINKTMATEPLYLDNTYRNMTLDEAIMARKEIDQYFRQMPARARKVFGDNVDNFYERWTRGEYDKFIETGALTKEQVEMFTKNESEVKNDETKEDFSSNQSIPTAASEINNTTLGTN